MVANKNVSSVAIYQFPKEYQSADNIAELDLNEKEVELTREMNSSFSLRQSNGELGFWSRVSVYRGVPEATEWARDLAEKFNLLNKNVEKVLSAGGPSWVVRQEIAFEKQRPELVEAFLWFYSLKRIHRRGEITFEDKSSIVMNRDEDKIFYSSPDQRS